MANKNRNRYSVTLGPSWRRFTRQPPDGWSMLGTIQRGMEIGALAESPARVLVVLKSERITEIDQRKARAALAAAQEGRQAP